MSTDDELAFIIHLRRERRELPGEIPVWRGLITQVGTPHYHYFTGFDEICDFVRSAIEDEPPRGSD